MIAYPAGLVINVKTQYSAVGDGVTDDTTAILNAIKENIGPNPGPIIYFPAGVYLVSDRLPCRKADGVTWAPWITFQGESRDTTTIRLANSSSGFGDPTAAKAVLFTASDGKTTGAVDWTNLGEGNEAFRNDIRDLTIDTGSGNPGAIGIDYLVSNMGCIRNVRILSGDGAGVAGISMTRRWPGPGFIKNVEVTGFDYGVRIAQSQYSMVFEHITLKQQRVAGLLNEQNVPVIRDLQSTNQVPAIINRGSRGLVVLIDAALTGGSSASSAIENEAGEIFCRNATATGYKSVINNRGTVVAGMKTVEFVSRATVSLFGSSGRSLGLLVKETPEWFPSPPARAVNVVTAHGAVKDDSTVDNLAAFQEAIDSGAATVYVPPGKYLVSGTIVLRGSVERFDMMGAWIGPFNPNTFGGTNPIFQTGTAGPPVVVLERIGSTWIVGNPTLPGIGIEHAAAGRTLVIRDGGAICRNVSGSGDLFIENGGSGGQSQFVDTNCWARQLDPEGPDPIESFLRNNNSNLWILGCKTEKNNTVILTQNGGNTELFGGFHYPTQAVPATLAAFIGVDSNQSLCYATNATTAANDYTVQVRETVGATTRELLESAVTARANASLVPLYSDHDLDPTDAVGPPLPTRVTPTERGRRRRR